MSLSQLLGGAPSEAYTASSSHTMPAKGFWCSCCIPSVWPISCTAVPMPLCGSDTEMSQPKFIVRSLCFIPNTSRPTYDHEPSSSIKPIRISASSLFFTSKKFSPMPSFFHIANAFRPVSICAGVPCQLRHWVDPSENLIFSPSVFLSKK